MKKLTLTMVMLSLLSSVCFAQLVSSPAAPVAPAVAEAKKDAATIPTSEITGKIKSVSMADAAKGTPASIVIIDSMGKEAALTVLPSTLIVKEGKKTTLDEVTQNASVRVKYIENQGAKAALGIQIAG